MCSFVKYTLKFNVLFQIFGKLVLFTNDVIVNPGTDSIIRKINDIMVSYHLALLTDDDMTASNYLSKHQLAP